MMLNPATDKFLLEFSSDFFPTSLTQKYDNYMFHMNGPVKYLQAHIMETIQSVNIPGWNVQTTETKGLNNLRNVPGAGMGNRPGQFPSNTVNRTFAGSAPINEIVDGNIVNITFRNSILNWMYLWECLRGYYDRTRSLNEFRITMTIMDAAEIPLLQFIFSDCFVAVMPGLEFSFAQSFREAKTIDAGFIFNKIDVNFMIPGFKLSNAQYPINQPQQ
jgi:hypothetical protein